MAKKKKAVRRKKAAPKSIGLTTQQVCAADDPRARTLTAQVTADGGAVLGSYSDPFGGTCGQTSDAETCADHCQTKTDSGAM